jgi:YesN/AraC family two-component response regulator
MIKTIVVDDEPAALERYSAYVRDHGRGFSVAASCRSAAEAFAAAERFRPALILTDIRMPGEDGLSLLGRLRDSGWKGLAVIISGYDDFTYAQTAIRLDVFDFLLKPVFPEDMESLLDRAALQTGSCMESSEREGSSLYDFVRASLATRASSARSEGNQPEPVRKAIWFIESRFDSRFSVDEVARAACVSATWLSLSFRRIYGCSLMEYARIFRVGKARELLAGTDLPIKEIADQLAFPDLPTFSKLFSKISGISPGAYRKSARMQGGIPGTEGLSRADAP